MKTAATTTKIINSKASIRRRRLLTAVIGVAILLSHQLPRVAQAADGDLDLSFGVSGRVTTDFANDFDQGEAVAIQSDGRIVVTGSAHNIGATDDFALARYHADGSLDTTFGSGEQLLGQTTLLLGLGTQPIAIPVTTPVTLSNQRLKLTISSAVSLNLNLQMGASTYLEVTNFVGTP